MFRPHGVLKYKDSSLLLSSDDRRWRSIGAELRRHDPGTIEAIPPHQMELTLAVEGNNTGLVRRQGAGDLQEVVPRSGTLWMSPVAVGDNEISVTATLPRMLHLYIPTRQFELLADDANISANAERSIRYAAGFEDPLIVQLAQAILSELEHETAAGTVLVESVSLAIAARLLHSHMDSGNPKPPRSPTHRLDDQRLRRVFDYVEEHLTDALSVEEMAGVACLSVAHFSRMFATATGLSPYRYMSQQRMALVRRLLLAKELPLTQIAFECGFSSQANFHRAFVREMGASPGAWRREHG